MPKYTFATSSFPFFVAILALIVRVYLTCTLLPLESYLRELICVSLVYQIKQTNPRWVTLNESIQSSQEYELTASVVLLICCCRLDRSNFDDIRFMVFNKIYTELNQQHQSQYVLLSQIAITQISKIDFFWRIMFDRNKNRVEQQRI